MGSIGTYTGLKAKGLGRSGLGPSQAHTHTWKGLGSYAHPLSLALVSAEDSYGLFYSEKHLSMFWKVTLILF